MSDRIVVMQDVPIEVWEDGDLRPLMHLEQSARDAANEQHATTDEPPEQTVIYMTTIIEGDDVTEIEVAREHAEFARIRYLFRAGPA